ncbi:pentapeptide repeat-containing protein [Streptomyces libani]
MSMSILQGASFSKARMDGVDLTGSQMARVNLVEATLDGADLTDAFLHQANLSRSVLGGANLRDANMNAAVLHGADLSDALGLTAGQIARAKIDEETVLPSELADHPSIRLMLDRQKHDVSEG